MGRPRILRAGDEHLHLPRLVERAAHDADRSWAERGAKDWKAYMRDSGIRLLFAYSSTSSQL